MNPWQPSCPDHMDKYSKLYLNVEQNGPVTGNAQGVHTEKNSSFTMNLTSVNISKPLSEEKLFKTLEQMPKDKCSSCLADLIGRALQLTQRITSHRKAVLYLATAYKIQKMFKHEEAQEIKVLIEKALSTYDFKEGDNLLHYFIDYGHTHIVEYLIENKPDLAFQANAKGELPLHVAISRGDIGIIKKLLSMCCNLSKQIGSVSETPKIPNFSSPTNLKFIPFFNERAGKFSAKEIAQYLWLNPEVLISDDMVQKVNKAAVYLKEQGFELIGIKADGDCFCNAFLKSYEILSTKIPILDSQRDKISYLRDLIAKQYDLSQKDSEKSLLVKRTQEIKKNGEWLTAMGEGDLLANLLDIPIRTVTVNKDSNGCGIIDMLTFAEKGKAGQKWKKIQESEKPKEYIFIVDLGGHFVCACPSSSSIEQDKTQFSRLQPPCQPTRLIDAQDNQGNTPLHLSVILALESEKNENKYNAMGEFFDC